VAAQVGGERSVDPSSLASQRALATFLIAAGRAREAEAPLKAVAESTKTTAAELALADYYLTQNRPDEARPLLENISKKEDGFAPAKIRLAQLDYAQKRTGPAHEGIKAVLAKDPKEVDALVLQAQMLLAERKTDDSLVSARAAVAANPQAATAQTVLGDGLVAKSEPESALRAYTEALRLNPRIVNTWLKIAQLQIQRGDAVSAVTSAEEAVKRAPASAAARMIRARALIAHNEYDRARDDLDVLTKALPRSADVHALMGDLHLVRQNRAAARQSFDFALALDPASVPAVRGRVYLDLLEGRGDQARQLVEKRLEQSPNNPQLLLLASTIYAATKDPVKQETALNKTLEIDPDNLQAFAALAAMYVRQGKLDEARARYEKLATRESSSVAARTMIGLIYEAQNNPAEAKKAYERVLEEDPDAAVAANNLAWRYAEDGGNLDVALQLAQTAQRKIPDSPEVNDTLGWIYLKKDLAKQAIDAFQASVQRNPNAPNYRYHLGMAHAKAGDKAKAAAEFDQVLKLKPDHKEAAAARRALGSGS
jgi:tetratricopeptide (TPR) repeat protein